MRAAPSRRRSSSPAPSSQRPIAVALVGSSGGSTLRSAAHEEVASLSKQLSVLGNVTLSQIIFVKAAEPLDHASRTTTATLWDADEHGQERCVKTAQLDAINAHAKKLDAKLAASIARGEVDAIVLVSADLHTHGINRASLDAAVAAQIPTLGTGGAGLGLASEAGARLLQLSGTRTYARTALHCTDQSRATPHCV